jgi:hypothetical protein
MAQRGVGPAEVHARGELDDPPAAAFDGADEIGAPGAAAWRPSEQSR